MTAIEAIQELENVPIYRGETRTACEMGTEAIRKHDIRMQAKLVDSPYGRYIACGNCGTHTEYGYAYCRVCGQRCGYDEVKK